ncbi:hypothetical protein AB0395_45600 [Streptosporangium sp. NPDC051023]|uniref:hypothetical protein n=1 Tax=Streptosporangium sp. NPDC051023 TaxID=3155410 RepID=UPI00344BDEE7
MFPGKAFEALWERLARRRAELDFTPRVEPVAPPAEVLAAMSAPPTSGEGIHVRLPAVEDTAKLSEESEALRLRLLATEVDLLGASPAEAARRLFGGDHD